MTTVKEALKSLDAWHSDEVRGAKVYFAEAVKIALEKVAEMEIYKIKCEYCKSRNNLISVSQYGDRSIVCHKCFKKVFCEEIKLLDISPNIKIKRARTSSRKITR